MKGGGGRSALCQGYDPPTCCSAADPPTHHLRHQQLKTASEYSGPSFIFIFKWDYCYDPLPWPYPCLCWYPRVTPLSFGWFLYWDSRSEPLPQIYPWLSWSLKIYVVPIRRVEGKQLPSGGTRKELLEIISMNLPIQEQWYLALKKEMYLSTIRISTRRGHIGIWNSNGKFKFEIPRAGGGWDTYFRRILILQRGLTFRQLQQSGLIDTCSAR